MLVQFRSGYVSLFHLIQVITVYALLVHVRSGCHFRQGYFNLCQLCHIISY